MSMRLWMKMIMTRKSPIKQRLRANDFVTPCATGGSGTCKVGNNIIAAAVVA